MPASAEPATSFHNVQESSNAVSRSKMTASYFMTVLGGLRLAAHVVEQVEHALAPAVDGIVGLQQFEGRGDARPQERAGQGIIGIARMVATQERLLLQHPPRRLQHSAEIVDTLL